MSNSEVGPSKGIKRKHSSKEQFSTALTEMVKHLSDKGEPINSEAGPSWKNKSKRLLKELSPTALRKTVNNSSKKYEPIESSEISDKESTESSSDGEEETSSMKNSSDKDEPINSEAIEEMMSKHLSKELSLTALRETLKTSSGEDDFDSVAGGSESGGIKSKSLSKELSPTALRKMVTIWSDEDELIDSSEVSEYESTESSSESEEDASRESSVCSMTSAPHSFNWSMEPPSLTLPKIPFIGTPGLKESPSTITPFSFFSLFLTPEFLKLISDATNKYGALLFTSEPNKNQLAWKPVTEEELKLFVGLLFHMGTIKISRIKEYWCTHPLFSIHVFSKCMSRNRFIQILRALYFCQEESDDKKDLQKVAPVINYLNSRMEELYSPERELSIESSMILKGGKLSSKRYMQGRRQQYVIKLYTLIEVSGLVLKCNIYGGGHKPSDDVLIKLLEGKLGLGHSIYVDKNYSSVDLYKSLLAENTFLTGILRSSRKNNPPMILGTKLNKGERIYRYSDEGICVLKWKEKKDVLMISTEHGNSMQTVRSKKGEMVQKPTMIVEYTKLMGGTQQQDRMYHYYPFERNPVRWHSKVGIHIIHIMLMNSFCLFLKNTNTPKINFYDFRMSIIKSLLSSRLEESIPPPSNTSTSRIHTPVMGEKQNNKVLRKRCKECSKQGKRRDTSYVCLDCPEKPGLCLTPCFRQYHKY